MGSGGKAWEMIFGRRERAGVVMGGRGRIRIVGSTLLKAFLEKLGSRGRALIA